MPSVDFYDIESFLTDEEKLVRKSTARFVDQEILPCIRDCFEQGKFPDGIIKKLGETAILGASLQTHG